MYAHELSLTLSTSTGLAAVLDELQALLAAYYRNGQIQGRWHQQPIIEAGRLSAQLLTLDADSLAPAHNGPYVLKSLARLAALTPAAPQFRQLGTTEPGYSGGCRCARCPYYVLYTHCLTIASPVRCGGCHGAVPLYRLPLPATGDRGQFLDWQTNYQACDDLQLHAAVGERWATRQLSDPRSDLSRQGRELAVGLEAATGIPTYYYLFNYRRLSLARDRQRPCPVCGQSWLLPGQLHGLYDFRCERDRLLSSLTPNN